MLPGPTSRRGGARPRPALVLAALALAGCAGHIGPRALPVDNYRYNQAIVRSWDEQLLLNLVRLRYRDTPLFLEIGTVVTSLEVAGALGASGTWSWPGDASSAGVSIGGTYTEAPTVTYTPLQGETFSTRLLSPISPVVLMLLSQSGWSIERLLLCCVQTISGIPNAVAAAGPTPDYVPEYRAFHRLAQLLRELQKAGRLEARLEPDGAITVQMYGGGSPEEDASIAEVRQLLALDPELDSYKLVEARRATGGDQIAVMGRSLLASLFFLSQAVEAPEADEAAGLVTVTRSAAGERFDWSQVTGKTLRVRSAAEPPADAAVRVLHRGTWFYIADDDLNSKTTFTLMTFLFNLTAAGKGGQGPLLTYNLP